MDKTPVIWALIDERPGTGNQCSAVAKALGLPFEEKQLVWSALANLPNFLTGASLLGLTAASKSELESPWPDIVIASGRRAANVARFIKKQSLDDCALVHIMHPGESGLDDFDLIAVPNHDGEVAPRQNIIRIIGAPHGIDDVQLSRARMRWHAKFSELDSPLFGLVVGGATKRRPFTSEMAEKLGQQLAAKAKTVDGSVLVASSPRTGDALAGVLKGLKSGGVDPAYVYKWVPGTSPDDNPYLGFLTHADELVVTGDSASMCSEVCAIGKPVHIFAPEGFLADKHKRLIDELIAGGYAKLLGDETDAGTPPPPLDVAGQIADEIRQRILPKVDVEAALDSA